MRQVNIRKLRKDLAAELSDLPFEVIRNGVVVAVVDYPVSIVSVTSTGGPLVYFNPVLKGERRGKAKS